MSDVTRYKTFVNTFKGKHYLCMYTVQHGTFLSTAQRHGSELRWEFQGPAKTFREWLGANWGNPHFNPLSDWETIEPSAQEAADGHNVVVVRATCRKIQPCKGPQDFGLGPRGVR